MNIEHFDLLSWVRERRAAPKQKTMCKMAGC
jgi:hypothetical protein